MVGQTSALSKLVHGQYLLSLGRRSTGTATTVIIKLPCTSSACSGWLVRAHTGQCFSGRIINSGSLFHVSTGYKLVTPREHKLAGLSADFICLHSSISVPPHFTALSSFLAVSRGFLFSQADFLELLIQLGVFPIQKNSLPFSEYLTLTRFLRNTCADILPEIEQWPY